MTNLKRETTRKQSMSSFPKKITFLSLWYAHVRVRIRGYKMFVFRKIWRALFSCYLRFEIRPFALSPTIYQFSQDPFHSLQIFFLDFVFWVKQTWFPAIDAYNCKLKVSLCFLRLVRIFCGKITNDLQNWRWKFFLWIAG